MKITHKISHKKISRDFDESIVLKRNISLFLLNKKGSYFFLPFDSSFSISNYQGWFNYVELKKNESNNQEYDLYKSIDNIYLDKKPTEIINNFVNAERISEKTSEKLTLLREVLMYSVDNYNGFVHIDLDFRGVFDFDDRGRIYKIYTEDMKENYCKENKTKNKKEISRENKSKHHKNKFNDVIILEYTKHTSDNLNEIDTKYYLAIKGITDAYEFVNRWEKKTYSFDASRISRSEFYIFKALKVLCKKKLELVFSFSDKKEKAIEKISKVLNNREKIDDAHKRFTDYVLKRKEKIASVSGEDTAFAYAGCINALKSLNVDIDISSKKITGIWAGLPWFFQFWSRDELVSCKALMLEEKYSDVKDIILRYMNEIKLDGRLPNRYPSSMLESADSIGWMFKRIYDLLLEVEKNNSEFDRIFNLHTLKYIRERLQFSIKKIMKNYKKEGLIFNGRLETWMDTHYSVGFYEDDFRDGFRIDVQCLFLGMLKLMTVLNTLLSNKFIKQSDKLVNITQNEFDYKKLEREFRDIVRQKFLVDIDGKKRLNDGFSCSHHDVCRPNVFLAHYTYPELLSNKEWEDIFDFALPVLWCDWHINNHEDKNYLGGGLSTIDKKHWLYQPHHTGENNKSYHRGDSWFFINNIAAICMHRLNKTKYKENIQKIINSSTEDILYNGFISYASEISSSTELQSFGCFCQAWSVATFIELIHEMYIE